MNTIRKKHGKLVKCAVSLLLIAAILCSCAISGNQVIINPNAANSINNANGAGNESSANAGMNSNNVNNNTNNVSGNTNSAVPGNNTDNTGNIEVPGGNNTANTNNSGNNTNNNTNSVNNNDNTGNNTNNSGNESSNTNTVEPVPKTWAEETIEKMSLTEKIGQLFIIRPEQLAFSWDIETQHSLNIGAIEFTDEMKANIKDYPAGGFILFEKNFKDPDQTKGFIAEFSEYSALIPFIAIDEEGGTKVSRLANSYNKGIEVPIVPAMGEIGESGDTSKAQEAGETISEYLKQYGFNLNFAPIADLDDSDSEGVIGDRSFGTDPQQVADMIKAFITGMHKNGILSCLKHFPGHGHAEIDTHADYSEKIDTWQELLHSDVIPFKENKDLTDMIMLSHISFPNVTGTNLPTTLSKVLTTSKLRNELNFKGVIITDSFHMGAIINTYTSDLAAIMAIKAGADIILMPDDYEKAFNAIRAAVDTGEISEQRINDSVLRILKLKEKLNDN